MFLIAQVNIPLIKNTVFCMQFADERSTTPFAMAKLSRYPACQYGGPTPSYNPLGLGPGPRLAALGLSGFFS